MEYTKLNLANGEVVSEEHLAHFEDAIAKLADEVNAKPTAEPITYIESTDTSNLVNIRDLESGTYVFYGKFKPFATSTASLTFSSKLLVNVVKRSADSQVMVFYPVNNCVQYLKVTDNSYERKNIYLNELQTAVDELTSAQPDWIATKEVIDGSNTIVISGQTLDSGMWTNRQMDIQPDIIYDVYINGTIYPCKAYEYDGGIILGNYTISMASANVPHNNEPFYIFWAGGSATAGLFGIDSTLSYPITLKVTEHSEVVYNKLPEGYLPESVDGIVIRSSTAGSSKKFKLTVDDTGTITPTEVT